MFGHAALASPTMLAPQGRSNHAHDAKVGLVKLPRLEQLVNNGSLLCNAIHLGHKSRIVSHCSDVEENRQGEKSCKQNVQNDVRRAAAEANCGRQDGCEPVQPDKGQSCCEYASQPGLKRRTS